MNERKKPTIIKIIREVVVSLCFVGILAGLSLTIFFFKPQEDVSTEENRNLAKTDDLATSSFLDHSMQDGVENVLSDQFFDRTELVFLKKKMDYQIKTALQSKEEALADEQKALFDAKISAMETGNRWRIGDSNYMIYYPITKESERPETLDKLLERMQQINTLAEDFPDIEFYVYHPLQAQELSFFDEANDFVCKAPEYLKKVQGKSTVPFTIMRLDDLDDYKECFYAADHHWNYYGAYRGYTEIMAMMNPEETPLQPTGKYLYKYPFYGTHGNFTGRVLPGDDFYVYTFNFPKFSIQNYITGETIEDAHNPNEFAKEDYAPETDYYYNEAYSTYGGRTLFTVKSNADKENLLVIGDSYSVAVIELIASHYHNTYAIQMSNQDTQPIDYYDFLQTHDVDKVLFMTTIENWFLKGAYEVYEIVRPEDFNNGIQ